MKYYHDDLFFSIAHFNLLISYVYLVVENVNDTINQLQPVDIKVWL